MIGSLTLHEKPLSPAEIQQRAKEEREAITEMMIRYNVDKKDKADG